MPEVNYVAVLVAAVAAFILGAIWYSPAGFAKPWMAENHFPPDAMQGTKPPMGRLLALAFLAALATSLAMAVLLVTQRHHSLTIGVKRGFAAGVCWLAIPMLSGYSFEQRSVKLWMINAGYYVVQFTLVGAILGVLNN